MRLAAAVGYEHAGWVVGTVGSRAAELIGDRLQLVPPDPSDPSWVRAVASLGRALSFTGDPEGDRLCDSALAHARRSGDDGLVGYALQAGLGYDLGPDRALDRLERAEELSALAERTGVLDQLAPAAYNRAVLSYVLGDAEGVERAAADMERAARVTGEAVWGYYGSVIAFGRQLAGGRLAQARRTCEELRRTARSVGVDDPDGQHGLHVFMVQRESGALEQIRPLVTGEESPDDSWAPGLLGLYTELRLLGPAARLLDRVLEDSLAEAESRRRASQWPGVLALLAEAVLLLEDEAAAERLRPELARYSGHNLVLGAFDGPFGSADRFLAGLDSLLGRGSPEDLFDAALELDTRMGAVVHQAHGLALHVVHRRRRGLAGPATDELAARAARLSARYGLGRVRWLLTPPAPASVAVRFGRDDGLTARELEVLALLGQGCSNRTIARRLHITENTTANHVRSILLKTDSQNRTQAAMYGRERAAREAEVPS